MEGPARLVLLVGGAAEVRALCERASEGMAAVVRAQFVGTAVEFLRTMRPALVVAAPDVAPRDLGELRRHSAACSIPVIALREGDSMTILKRALERLDKKAVAEDAGPRSLPDENDRGSP
jgi:hypothetical protein